MIVVSDTSPISGLIQIGRLSILHQIFNQIIIPLSVKQELLVLGEYGFNIAELEQETWILTKKPTNSIELQKLKQELDEGESEAIALALEYQADTLLMDERKGYKMAEQYGLKPIGLPGVLLEAKVQKIISEVKPIMDQLIATGSFWVSEAVYQKILLLAKEE